MKKKIYWTIISTLLIVGLVLQFWSAFKMDAYPTYKEIRKEAFETVETQYLIGLGCIVLSWIIIKFNKYFK